MKLKLIQREINEIKKTFVPWIILFFILTIFFFIFGLEKVEISGTQLILPVPSIKSIPLQVLEKIRIDLLPDNIKLLVTNPFNVFLIQIQISLFLAFLFSLPLLLYNVIKYLSTALYKHEKQAIFKAVIPSVILFLIGCTFGYAVIIPLTLKLMDNYADVIGAATYFEIGEFVSFVLAAIISTGITFMLPIFMKVLNNLGIASREFWIKNFKYSLIVFVIFTAVITPDGTGITQVILTMILSALYFVGILLSKNV